MEVMMSEARQDMIRLIAAKYGLSSAEYVQAAISAALLSEARADETVRLMLLKATGISWEQLEKLA